MSGLGKCPTEYNAGALAGIAQWIERGPAHVWDKGHIPSGGWGRGNHTLMFLSLSSSFPSPLSKSK